LLARNRLNFAFDDFPMAPLRLPYPGGLDVDIGWPVKFGDKGADEIRLLVRTQCSNPRLKLSSGR
jgi:hypothetical protein